MTFQSFVVPGKWQLHADTRSFEPGASPIGLGVLAVNRHSNEERCLQLLLPDDRLSTTLAAIHEICGICWTIGESWDLPEIMPSLPIEVQAVAA